MLIWAVDYILITFKDSCMISLHLIHFTNAETTRSEKKTESASCAHWRWCSISPNAHIILYYTAYLISPDSSSRIVCKAYRYARGEDDQIILFSIHIWPTAILFKVHCKPCVSEHSNRNKKANFALPHSTVCAWSQRVNACLSPLRR